MQQINTQYRYLPWAIWIISASIFFVEYIIRTSPLTMVRELISTFNASSLEISALSAYFLYAYVAMQVPVGMIIDKHGARISLLFSSTLCVVATIMFASTDNLYIAQLSRFLLGFAASFAFVSSLKLASSWFTPEKFSVLVGLTQGLGMVGGAAGASITGRMMLSMSWQKTTLIYAAALALIVFLAFLILQNHPKGAKEETIEEQQSIWKNLLITLKHPQTWYISLLAGFLFVPTGVFCEFWGSYFLSTSHGISKTLANDAIAVIYIGWAIGSPLSGMLANYLGRKKVLILSTSLCSIVIPLVIYSPQMSINYIYILLFLYGIFNSGLVAAYTAAAELHPKSMNGVVLGFANGMSVVVGAFCIQLVGALQDYFRAASNDILTPYDLRLIMSVNVIALLISLLLSFVIVETYKKQNN